MSWLHINEHTSVCWRHGNRIWGCGNCVLKNYQWKSFNLAYRDNLCGHLWYHSTSNTHRRRYSIKWIWSMRGINWKMLCPSQLWAQSMREKNQSSGWNERRWPMAAFMLACACRRACRGPGYSDEAHHLRIIINQKLELLLVKFTSLLHSNIWGWTKCMVVGFQ